MRLRVLLTTSVACVMSVVAPAAADRLAFTLGDVVYTDDDAKALKSPEGIACSDDGSVIAADSGNGRLLSFTYSDGQLTRGKAIKLKQIANPVRVEVTSKGDLLVLDQRTRKIFQVAKDGTSAREVGLPADVVPASFKQDGSGTLYVLDVAASRVITVAGDGELKRAIELPADEGPYMDLAVGGDGSVYAIAGPTAKLYVARKGATKFSVAPKDELSTAARHATYLTMDAKKSSLVVVDQHGHGVVFLSQDGAVAARRLVMGWRNGLVYYPSQVCMNKAGDLFVTDRGNNRLQVFAAGN